MRKHNFDKDELLKITENLIEKDFTSEQKSIILSFVKSNLPEYPDYY